MRSKQLDLSRYPSDKIVNSYLERYDPIFEPQVNKKITLLELGIFQGGSLMLWRDYFPEGKIVGVDLNIPEDFQPGERIHMFKGSQGDTQFLSEVARQTASEGFDIIIDDASHIGHLTKTAFWHLFDNHLKPGGLYVIEDWGTGYWEDWPDGRSINHEKSFFSRMASRFDNEEKRPFPCHSYGMVGFVKELVDEQGAAELTRMCGNGKSARQTKFEGLLITPDLIFVTKKRA
jgi:SAM-dependent methyltransferase